MIPFACGFWIPTGALSTVPAIEATHVFRFDRGEINADMPVDALKNAKLGTNYSTTWRDTGFGTNNTYPPHDQALSLNPASSSAYYKFKSDSSVATLKTIPWTVEFYGKPLNAGNSVRSFAFAHNPDNGGGWVFMIGSGDNKLGVYMPGVIYQSSDMTPDRNAWKHYALTFDGTYLHMCYDGRIYRYGPTTLNSAYSGEDYYYRIGAAGGGFVTDRGFQNMDSFRIIHGTCLYSGTTGTSYTVPLRVSFEAYPNPTGNVLLNFNGTDGATSTTDVYGHTVTFHSDAQIDTTNKKFGTGSLLLAKSGDRISIPDSADLEFSDNDWSIEFWYRPTNLPSSEEIQVLYHKLDNMLSYSPVQINLLGPSNIYAYCSYLGSNSDIAISGAHGMTAGTWYHFALVRQGQLITFFKDGTPIGSSATIGTNSILNNTHAHSIGGAGDGSYCADGAIDDFRMTFRWCRYSRNTYTTPTSELTE